MQLSSDVQIPDGLLAANVLLSEKPRLGFRSDYSTLRWGSSVVISSTAIGISGTLYDSRIESRYTGKERDGTPMTESGNDYFQARYYNSSVGRFLSPDWSAKVEPIPYSKLDNPQTLNLYAYVGNNPLGRADDDGHDWIDPRVIAQFAHDVTVGAIKGFGRIAFAALSMTDNRITNPAYAHMQDTPASLQYSNTTQAVAGTVAPLLVSGFGGSVTVTASAPAVEMEAAPQLTTLFRAVDSTEMGDLQATGTWNPSPNGADGKGFFYSQDSASQFGAQQSTMGGPSTSVVTSTAPTDMVNGSYQQSAATEGNAVFIQNQNLPQVKPQVPPQQ